MNQLQPQWRTFPKFIFSALKFLINKANCFDETKRCIESQALAQINSTSKKRSLVCFFAINTDTTNIFLQKKYVVLWNKNYSAKHNQTKILATFIVYIVRLDFILSWIFVVDVVKINLIGSEPSNTFVYFFFDSWIVLVVNTSSKA